MEIRRKVKNVVYKYSEPERLVREATSNDPWGPTSTVMSEIADLTYDYVAFEEIMPIIWKRLNDKGKNWRHVYKSLVLLDYLIKCGDERVASICIENIHSIQTLKDFQFFEEHKDLGLGVREKSKALVRLLRDDELLNHEREKGQNVKEKFQGNETAIGSYQKRKPGDLGKEIRKQHDRETRHPKSVMKLNFDETSNESEEDDIRKAMKLSKEDYENTLKKKLEEERLESLKLKIALEQSEEEALSVLRPPPKTVIPTMPLNLLNISTTDTIEKKLVQQSKEAPRTLPGVCRYGDLLNSDKFDPWSTSCTTKNGNDVAPVNDPWMSNLTVNDQLKCNEPVATNGWSNQRGFPNNSIIDDIFGDNKPCIDFNTSWTTEKVDKRLNDAMDSWTQPGVDVGHTQTKVAGSLGSLTDIGFDHLSAGDSMHHSASATNVSGIVRTGNKSAEDFLGDHAKLVNLDRLLPMPTAGVYSDTSSYGQRNQFAIGSGVNKPSNPFTTVENNRMPMNQNRTFHQVTNNNSNSFAQVSDDYRIQSSQSLSGAPRSQYSVQSIYTNGANHQYYHNNNTAQWPLQPQYNQSMTSHTLNPFM